MGGKRRFARDAQGRFHPRLRTLEQQLLENLPRQAQMLLVDDDPSTERLFPPAYLGDAEAEAEYRSLMADSLRTRHQLALDTLAATAGEETIDEEQLQMWMGALEVMRLVLGTQLDVTEDMDAVDPSDPRIEQFAVYQYLSMLQDEIVGALTTALPPAGED